MERLTKKSNDGNFTCECGWNYFEYGDGHLEIFNKLGKLEDIEQELGIPLEALFKALKQGYIWMWDINGYYKASIIKLVCSLEKNEDGEDKYIWEFDIRYTGRPIGTRDNLCGIELKNYNEPSKFYKWWFDNPEEELE